MSSILVVSIDVTSPSFRPRKPNYERTKTCLAKLPKLSLLLSWHPAKSEVCPSSIAKYFHDLGYNVEKCKPQFTTRTEYGVKVPELNFGEKGSEDGAFELVEWIGMLSLKGDLESGTPDGYVTTYEAPEPNRQFGQVRYLEWKGFFSEKAVVGFFEELR